MSRNNKKKTKNYAALKGATAIAILIGAVGVIGASASYRFGPQELSPSLEAIQVNKDLEPAQEFTSPKNLYGASVSDEDLNLVLSDAGHRVDKDFQIPAILKRSVGFWLKIYTRYSTLQAVLFDSNTMEIYEELDFRPIARRARNQMAYEIMSENMIKRKKAAYQKGFLKLKKNSYLKSGNLSHEESNILALHKHTRLSIKQLSSSLRLMRGQRDNIIKGLSSVQTFTPKMEAIFEFFKVPVEITRLSLVESSFNLNAQSKVGAAGVWQFMEASGKSYLTINKDLKIDERLSPLKATAAAAKMLAWNYRYFKNWPLAIISYNHGLRHLPRLKEGDNGFEKISHLFKTPRNAAEQKRAPLGWASRNYYSEFLAVLYAEKYQELFYGQAPDSYIRPVSFSQVKSDQSAYEIAMSKGISIQDFRLFNADISNIHQLVPKGYWVVAPSHGQDLQGLKQYAAQSLRKISWGRTRVSISKFKTKATKIKSSDLRTRVAKKSESHHRVRGKNSAHHQVKGRSTHRHQKHAHSRKTKSSARRSRG